MRKSSGRKVTCQLLEQAENGLISWEAIARASLNYMSERDVADMADTEDLIVVSTEENDE